MAKLQDERTVQKICVLDNHVMMAFAGLTADARIIIKKARQVRSSFCFSAMFVRGNLHVKYRTKIRYCLANLLDNIIRQNIVACDFCKIAEHV